MGVHSDLSGGLGPSNHIGLEEIHRFSSSVVTKAELLFQSNISLDLNFEVKITLEHICWFSLSAHTKNCLSVLSSLQSNNLKKTQ